MTAAAGRHEAGGSPSENEDRPPRNPLTWILIILVRAYQEIVSPWLAPTCRYYPSCSAYAVAALRRHGMFKGAVLAAWRLLRCNPWSLGGVDHVPPRGSWSNPPAERVGSTDETDDEGPRNSGDASRARTLEADTRGARTVVPKDR
ncbi:hypothetical protein GCM10023169_23260 [Georgenia halophila]|uniref:Putative membrane protein insertion efficiency factor n=1 Tax=Georgenia halophila TaxID=620889 RepID=A0ABP8L9P1_9MICO